MGWVRAGVLWALFGTVVGVVLMLLFGRLPDPEAFVLLMTVVFGLYGLFYHHRDRLDATEDAAMDAVALDPRSSPRAVEWAGRLRQGDRMKVGFLTTLTPEGVEWGGLRRIHLRWADVDHVSPWTMSVHSGIRSSRGVALHADGRSPVIRCSKRKAVDVLATCHLMTGS